MTENNTCSDYWQFNKEQIEAFAKEIAEISQAEPIGEMKENGVNWFKRNPHAYPVGTKFYTSPPADKQDSEITTLRKRVRELEKWQEMAFLAHPNIDIDIEHHQRNNHD